MTTLKLVVNESEAQSTYVETEVVEGVIDAITLEPSERPFSIGRNAGRKQTWFVIRLKEVTELKMVDGTTPNASEWSVRYPYSLWDDVRNEPSAPMRDNKQWFSVVVPVFKEAGIVLGGIDTNISDLVGSVSRFEFQTKELPYTVFKRDEETGDPNNNFIVWETPPSTPDAKDGVGIRVTATYSAPLPTKIVVFNPADGVKQAAKLFKQITDEDEFKSGAMDDELIQKVPSLYRAISLGEYDPKSFKL
jgi:hypothetical protein